MHESGADALDHSSGRIAAGPHATDPVDGAVVRHVTVAENGPVDAISTLEMANAGAGGGVGTS